MKIWLFAVLLAFAVAAASAAAEAAAETDLAKAKTDVDVAVTDVPETEADAEADAEAKVETEGEAEEESETEAKEGEKEESEKEEGGSNESSSEENEDEKEEGEESSTKANEEVTTVKVLSYVPVVYSTEAYIKPAYVPTAATYSKSNYIQIPGPVYRPAVTTEAPKPLVTYNVVKAEISAAVETPKTESKDAKPTITVVSETTTKSAPIVFEKPSSTPVATVRKSGWVRAPGYNLGYARSENSDPAVVETPKTSVVRSEAQVKISKTSDDVTAKTVATRQAYRQWFFKPKSAIPTSK